MFKFLYFDKKSFPDEGLLIAEIRITRMRNGQGRKDCTNAS